MDAQFLPGERIDRVHVVRRIDCADLAVEREAAAGPGVEEIVADHHLAGKDEVLNRREIVDDISGRQRGEQRGRNQIDQRQPRLHAWTAQAALRRGLGTAVSTAAGGTST